MCWFIGFGNYQLCVGVWVGWEEGGGEPVSIGGFCSYCPTSAGMKIVQKIESNALALRLCRYYSSVERFLHMKSYRFRRAISTGGRTVSRPGGGLDCLMSGEPSQVTIPGDKLLMSQFAISATKNPGVTCATHFIECSRVGCLP